MVAITNLCLSPVAQTVCGMSVKGICYLLWFRKSCLYSISGVTVTLHRADLSAAYQQHLIDNGTRLVMLLSSSIHLSPLKFIYQFLWQDRYKSLAVSIMGISVVLVGESCTAWYICLSLANFPSCWKTHCSPSHPSAIVGSTSNLLASLYTVSSHLLPSNLLNFIFLYFFRLQIGKSCL